MTTFPLRVVLATASDTPALLPLMERLVDFEHCRDTFAVTPELIYQQAFARQLPDFHCLVDRHVDGQLGECWYTTSFSLPPALSRPFHQGVSVDEAYRGHWLGKALLRAAVRWAMAAWNEAGRRFYEPLDAQANPVWVDCGFNGDALLALVDPPAPR